MAVVIIPRGPDQLRRRATIACIPDDFCIPSGFGSEPWRKRLAGGHRVDPTRRPDRLSERGEGERLELLVGEDRLLLSQDILGRRVSPRGRTAS
ncbi:MAG: hypothetical protein M3Y17_13890 [Actinomycetota bacterium]|nr:hypothetical protein [Actinomycetota bacterium]